MKIFQYSEKHKAQVIDLIVGIQREEFDISITAAEQPDLADIKSFYQRDAGNFWLATFNDQLIGTITLLDIGNGQAALRKMFVKKEFRGKIHSVATKLLETLLNHASNNEVREIYLGTTAMFLAAHRFYEKKGFTEIEEQELPAEFPIMEVDTKFYKYVL